MMRTVRFVLKSGESVVLHADPAHAKSAVDGFLDWCRLAQKGNITTDRSNSVFATDAGGTTVVMMSEVAAVVVE